LHLFLGTTDQKEIDAKRKKLGLLLGVDLKKGGIINEK
jgi:hypothetical protein